MTFYINQWNCFKQMQPTIYSSLVHLCWTYKSKRTVFKYTVGFIHYMLHSCYTPRLKWIPIIAGKTADTQDLETDSILTIRPNNKNRSNVFQHIVFFEYIQAQVFCVFMSGFENGYRFVLIRMKNMFLFATSTFEVLFHRGLYF